MLHRKMLQRMNDCYIAADQTMSLSAHKRLMAVNSRNKLIITPQTSATVYKTLNNTSNKVNEVHILQSEGRGAVYICGCVRACENE